MEGYGFLIAVRDASVPVVVLQILNDKLLPDIDHAIVVLGRQIQQLYRKLVGPYAENLALLIEL